MTKERIELKGGQRRAVEVRGRDVVVTAGAGSGKTRTLVERYLALLAEGHSPRQILAITFTEKAAREMRNRIRAATRERGEEAGGPEKRSFWRGIEAQMDAARISTIHAFCAELLRAHPAEAGVDPGFEVAEEGTAALLRREAVKEALAWAVAQEEVAPLFSALSPRGIEGVLSFLLARRLDAAMIVGQGASGSQAGEMLGEALWGFVEAPAVAHGVQELRRMRTEGELEQDAGEKLAAQLAGLLDLWEEVRAARESGDWVTAAEHLYTIRREYMRLNIGKKTSRAKELLQALRHAYDERVNLWLGGARPADPPPDPTIEIRFGQDLGRMGALFEAVCESYRRALDERRLLDFDDLETGALRLLQDARIRNRWREGLAAVLVDEFQDTNERQREIVEALCEGSPGRLFVVGDARQSIYRFRGADVTVFRRMGEAIEARGGEPIELDITFRAHSQLLRGLDLLLPAVMGEEGNPDEPYVIPYTPLVADRRAPRKGVEPPFIEFILGVGESAEAARPHAAEALVARLLELRHEGQIQGWGDVALLFRASTGFAPYEDALEVMGVPYVTVAGRGFYERPEIRDVLNILQALADPWNDLAMAGLLRSPAMGLTDAALYRLRWREGEPRAFYQALVDGLDDLDESDRQSAIRAREILAELRPLVGRLPVGELLKRVLDRTDYRAGLASAHRRYWQNIDKLLADAHASGLVNVSSFLEYLQSVRDIGVREGEAPVEAQGAVRLMTVHKAKGLEFPFVVIADASRQPRRGSEPAYLLPEIGLTFRPDRSEAMPLAYRFARWLDGRQSEAEENRLLYVAATRAREKLILSGHCTLGSKGVRTEGWMKALAKATDLDIGKLIGEPACWHHLSLGEGVEIAAWMAPEKVDAGRASEGVPEKMWPHSDERSLYKPIEAEAIETLDSELNEEPARDWRATGEHVHPPAAVIGLMVHRALERWLFPGQEGFERLLDSVALNEGMVQPAQRAAAIQAASRLLERFMQHPLKLEIDAAEPCYHELPYVRPVPGRSPDSGIMDLLYRFEGQWKLIDFKADELRDEDDLIRAIEKHRHQMQRYAEAVRSLLGVSPSVQLCFLDAMGEVMIRDVG